MKLLMFCLFAGFGGALRCALENYLPMNGTRALPKATLIVNVLGSFMLGLLASASPDVRLIVGTGFCGALTTFSGVSLQIYRRSLAKAWLAIIQYVGLTLLCGFVAAYVGLRLSDYLG